MGAIFWIHLALFLFLFYRLRTDLSLGNGYAGFVAWVMAVLILNGIFGYSVVFLIAALVPVIPGINKLFYGVIFKIPVLSNIFFEFGILLKLLARMGIPKEKIDEAIYKAHGIKMSELEKMSSREE